MVHNFRKDQDDERMQISLICVCFFELRHQVSHRQRIHRFKGKHIERKSIDPTFQELVFKSQRHLQEMERNQQC